MKTAYFVMGPESSGNRMLTEAFCKLGMYGEFGHQQKMDNLVFKNLPDNIVFRRSIPHGGQFPPVKYLIRIMQFAGYDVVPIVILREIPFTIKSQLKQGHVKDEQTAKRNIEIAHRIIKEELADIPHKILSYESFVTNPAYRDAFFNSLGLGTPDMEFFDANQQYLNTQESPPST